MIGRLRWPVGALGVLVGVYGGWLLWSREGSTRGLVDAAEWLVAGVVLHDFVLAPLVLGVVLVGGRVLPRVARAPLAVALVVLVPATVLAIPVLTGYGRRADNPTLDDRHYWIGWFVLVAVVGVSALVAALVRRQRR